MGVVDRIIEHAERLTATERRIAEVLTNEPQAIAFGTVAQVAERASTSGPSVVRLAVKLGYSGFVGLQAAVQGELSSQLRPAHQRIHDEPPTDLRGQVQQAELDNLATTFDAVAPGTLDAVVDLLADVDRHVWVLAGEVTTPVGVALCGQLSQLRAGVMSLPVAPAALGRAAAGISAGDVLVAIDISRYERVIVDAVRLARSRGVEVVALTDGPLSPLATPPALSLFFSPTGAGPFDSMVAGIGLVDLVVAGAATQLRSSAALRLEAVEAGWTELGAIVGHRHAAEQFVDLEGLDAVSSAGTRTPV